MPTAPLVIRAAPVVLARFAPYTAVLGVLLLILTTMRAAFGSVRREDDGVGWWAVPAIGVLLGLPLIAITVLLWMRARNLRIVLDDTTVTVHEQFGRSTSWPRHEITALRYVPLRTNQEQGAVVLLLGERRRVLATLWHKAWDADRLTPLAAALGVDIETPALRREAEGLTVAEARRQYPGIEIPVTFAHGLAIGCLGGILVLGYAAAWVAAMVLLSG